MHHHTSVLNFPLPRHASPNPNHHHTLPISLSVLSAGPHHLHHSFQTCKGIQVSAPHQCRSSSTTTTSNGNGAAAAHDWKLRSVRTKTIDVSTLGNLCVDIVLNVPKLPQPSREARQAYMEQLSKSPPDKKYWEAGGNCNVAIAAARLGLHCATIGHVGEEIYGEFLLDVLRDERISMVRICDDNHVVEGSSAEYETLLCWVLVDPMQRHGFCSRADFSADPAFSWLTELSGDAKIAIKQSRILFCNGYGFDELSPGLIISAVDYAVEVGTSVFFDPGPRGKSLSRGTPEEQRSLKHLLKMSDVVLVTSDEYICCDGCQAESLTGIGDPILAGQELLRNGVRTKWVIVKMGPRGSILVTISSISCAPAFKVNIIDTVGCGDSFVAAIAFGFLHNMPLVNTLATANAVGAATAMGCGAGRNVATLEKVLEIMRASNINEDDKFWNELLVKSFDAEEIIFLSKMVINGTNHRLNHVLLEKVVSELLPKLEATKLEGKVAS